ncbi:MAG: TonB-dependent receptor [Candidatus Symbiothrix sp.]|nr:TonB-dependent receptor [Candidatus Symbiothrix sp.]
MKHIIIILLTYMPFALFAQTTVKGIVTDNQGETLIGASVIEQDNPSNGTITGIDGDFSLQIKSPTSKITVSYISYKSKTLAHTTGEMRIVLEPDDRMLQEVEIVQVGFGTKSRISNTAAISQVNAAQLRQIPSTNLQNTLAGRLPGLFQLQGSGQPGKDAAELFIRGIGTFAQGIEHSPLILIDDIESDLTTLSRLTVNDIEDVSILKDAGSTAIFGVKGASGVILVTTRRGKEGKPKLTFRADYGFQRPTYKNELLNSYESLSLLKELHLNNQNTVALASERYFSDEALNHYRLHDDPYGYPDVDWYDLVYKKFSAQQQYTADVQGGTNKMKYFVSFAYLDQGGLFKDQPRKEDFENDYYQQRYNVRSNFDVNVTKDFLIKLNANAILTEINEPNLPSTRGASGSIFQRLLGAGITPYHYPAINPNGTFGGYTQTYINPLALFTYGGYNRQFRNNVNGNIALEHKLDFLTKGLKARAVLGLTNTWGFSRSLTRNEVLDYYYDPRAQSYEPIIPYQYILPTLAAGSENYAPMIQINTRFDVAYNRSFGDHNVDGLVLGNWYSNRTGAGNQRNSISYSGRLGYNYAHRYIAELSAGYNGSDEFPAGNRYQLFPAFSGGWNLAEEPYLKSFFEPIKVDMLKLRGSYGLSGSDKIAGNGYAYLENYARVMDYHFGTTDNSKIEALGMIKYPNPNIKWETDYKTDLGLDLRMFNSRLSLTVDYFYNYRKDILAVREGVVFYAGYLQVFSGVENALLKILPPANLGRTENQGWDGEISWRDQLNDDFSYFMRGTFSYAKNKILDMDEPPSYYKMSIQTGRPIGTLFGYVSEGFYNSWDEIKNSPVDMERKATIAPGDLKYKDISGVNGAPDGIIDNYDIVPIGNLLPDFNFGFSLGFTYKNFDVSTMFQGATGASVSVEEMLRLADGANSVVGSENGKPMPIHQGRWTYYDADGNYVSDPEQLIAMNKQATYPRLMPQNGNNKTAADAPETWKRTYSTFWLRSADYLRWKNLEVGYNFPKTWMERAGISGIRFYFSAQNLYTWSGLKEYQIDPESSKSGMTTYPQQQVYNLGCQISF